MGTESLQDDKGLQLNAMDWILDHHMTKEKQRRSMVDDLKLESGDAVLDLGSGPGLWASMFAEKVKPNGRVVCLDQSQAAVEYARARIENESVGELIEVQEGDFYDIPYPADSFDFVFFGNCFMYVTDVPAAIAEQKRVAKRGGRVAAKDFDGSVLVINPIDPQLSARVMSATARGLSENPPDPFFNNFFGRTMHGHFMEAGFRDVVTRSYAIQKVAPLIAEAKRYITANAQWYLDVGTDYLTDDDVQQWQAHFDPSSDDYILERDDFYFCMLEIVTEGTV